MKTFLSFIILFISQIYQANILYSDKDEKLLIEKIYNDNIKFKDSISLNENFKKTLKTYSDVQDLEAIKAVFYILKAENYLEYDDDLNTFSDTSFRNAISIAKKTQSTTLQIFSNIHYGAYLYRYRQMAKALPYYLHSVNLLDNTPKNLIVNLVQTYKQVGFYFGTLGDRKLSLKFLHLAEKNIDNDDVELATVHDNIGYFYLLEEDLPSSLKYLTSAKTIALKVKDYERYAKTLGNIGIYYYKIGDYKKAETHLLEDVKLSQELKSDKNTMFALINLSKVYLKMNNIANAQKYINMAEEYASTKSYYKVNEHEIAGIQLEIAKKTNNDKKELELRRKIENLEDLLANADGDNAIMKTNWNFQMQKFNDNLKLQQEKSKSQKITLTASIAILLMLLILSWVIYRSKRRKIALEQEQQESRISELQSEISRAEQKLNDSNQSLTSYREVLSKKNVQIENLTKQIKQVTNEENSHSELNDVLKSHLMTEENWLNFKKIFINEQPEYFQHLKTNFPDLTDANLRLLMLMRLGLSTREISNTLGITTDAIKKAKQRLKKKYEESYEKLF